MQVPDDQSGAYREPRNLSFEPAPTCIVGQNHCWTECSPHHLNAPGYPGAFTFVRQTPLCGLATSLPFLGPATCSDVRVGVNVDVALRIDFPHTRGRNNCAP